MIRLDLTHTNVEMDFNSYAEKVKKVQKRTKRRLAFLQVLVYN